MLNEEKAAGATPASDSHINPVMRAEIEQYDWSRTPLGSADTWPDTLKTVLGVVLDTAFPMLIMWGPDLIQVYNDGYIPIFGDKHPRSLGAPARDCWADIWNEVGPLLEGVYENGRAVFFENLPLMMERHGGYEQAYFTFSYSPIKENGEVRGIMCVVNETTAHVLREREIAERADALAQIDRAKTQFFNNISHEFRTPLTLMLGPLDDLLRTIDGAEQRRSVELARQNALRLLKLVNTLLEFARLQSGRVDMTYMPTALGTFTRDLCGLFRSAIEKAGLQFTIDITLDKPVYVDQSMWEKIVLNLLSNALKFTWEGSIEVVLGEVAGAAELTVRDTGCGIASSELPHIFERFRQVRSAKSRSHEGSGIGLALVDELVRLHGGSVEVSSEPGRGSEFRVRIPLGTAHLDPLKILTGGGGGSFAAAEQYLADIQATLEIGAKGPAVEAAPRTANRASILLADDNRDLREYVSRILRPLYDVVMVENGARALSALQSRRFDLVLSDIMMPEMSGLELLDALQSDEELQATPVIFLSARAGEESAVEALKRGAADYIVKPFSSQELLARVNAQLKTEARRAASSGARPGRWFDSPGDSRTNEVAFRTFADQLPIMVYQQDVTGAVSFTNCAWYEVTRLPRDPRSHSLDAWVDVVHPEDLDRTIAAISDAIEARAPYEVEYRIKAANAGEQDYRWHVARGLPQYTDGQFKGWIGTVIDVHDSRTREEVERAKREAATQGEKEFRTLADTIPIMVWAADPTGSIEWYNQRWYDYTGQSAEEAAGWGWQAMHHPEDFPRVMSAWPHSIATGEPFDMEFRLRRHDGEFRMFLTRVRPVRDERGNIVRWYGTNVDIQPQVEALERSKHVAETLQRVFLPSQLPQARNLRIDAVYQTAEKDAFVGGDWFDALTLPNGRIVLSIGDVTGHGLDASVIAGRLRQAVIDFAFVHNDASAVLERVNDVLRFQHPDVYATALVCFIDADGTRFSYASAGHQPPVIAYERFARVETLPYGGVPLGVEERPQFIVHEVPVRRDAVVALYTDGMTEFNRDIVGAEEKLKAAVAALVGDTSVARPAEAVRNAVLCGEATVDDAALLIVQFSEGSAQIQAAPGGPVEKTWRFHSSDAHAARMSRKELMAFIQCFTEDQDALFEAELILGEILANAVEHAPGLAEVHIDWTGENAVVTVADTGPGLSHASPALPCDDFSENGRGLFLVHALAEQVTVSNSCEHGTKLRAVLPVRRTR